jgi:hypothetical protein
VVVVPPLTSRSARTQVYTILCRTTFQSFACKDIDEGESYHQNDFSVDCNSGGYQAYAVIAGVFIVIYPIGIVAIFVALLYLNRKVLGDQAGGAEAAGSWWSGDLETFTFLVDGYRRETFWYEIVDFIRCRTANDQHCDTWTG